METQNVTANQETVETKQPQTASLTAATSESPVQTTDTNNQNSEYEFTRSAVEANSTQIRLADRDDTNDLDLFCYIKCNATDERVAQDCRGAVFHKDELVMRAFPYTPEYNHTEVDRLAELLPNFKDCRFFDAHEGALIRVFHFNNKWYVSTHRKLNAFRSKWASKESFGDIFKRSLLSEVEINKTLSNSLPVEGESVIDRFCETLNKNHQYMFHVRNIPENRIVCLAPEKPTLYHVGTFIDGNLDLDDNINVPRPHEHTGFANIDELASRVGDMSAKDHQGVIAFLPDNRQLKILIQEYQDYFRVRANEPSVKYRYLQVRMNKRLTNGLYTLYPEHAKDFEEYERTLYKIAQMIHRSYIARYINKRYTTVPTQEYKVMRACHTWHMEDRANNRISEERVIDVLNEQTATDLNHMIRRFRVDVSKQKEQHAKRQHVTPKLTGKTPKNTPNEDGRGAPENPISPMLLPQPVPGGRSHNVPDSPTVSARA